LLGFSFSSVDNKQYTNSIRNLNIIAILFILFMGHIIHVIHIIHAILFMGPDLTIGLIHVIAQQTQKI